LSFKVTAVFILALQNDVYVNHISEVSAVLMREKVEKLFSVCPLSICLVTVFSWNQPTNSGAAAIGARAVVNFALWAWHTVKRLKSSDIILYEVTG